MSTTVTYKGQTLTTVENQTKTLQTAGTWVEGDFTLTDVTQGGGGYSANDIASRNLSESITITANSVGAYAFYGCNCKHVEIVGGRIAICKYAFADSTIETLYAPSLYANNDADYAFENCGALREAEYGANSIGASTFLNCVSLSRLVFKEATTVYTSSFSGCIKLESVDFSKVTGFIRSGAFNGCSKLSTLIIRTPSVPTLSFINSFSKTPFASDGTGGTLYVPSALISNYQSATNWSTILGYANNQILPIEGSYYETHYADGSEVTA